METVGSTNMRILKIVSYRMFMRNVQVTVLCSLPRYPGSEVPNYLIRVIVTPKDSSQGKPVV